MPVRGRAHFLLQGARGEQGRMRWHGLWGGNDSKAGQKRYRKAIMTPAYAAMSRILRDGRRQVQPDLFAL